MSKLQDKMRQRNWLFCRFRGISSYVQPKLLTEDELLLVKQMETIFLNLLENQSKNSKLLSQKWRNEVSKV